MKPLSVPSREGPVVDRMRRLLLVLWLFAGVGTLAELPPSRTLRSVAAEGADRASRARDRRWDDDLVSPFRSAPLPPPNGRPRPRRSGRGGGLPSPLRKCRVRAGDGAGDQRVRAPEGSSTGSDPSARPWGADSGRRRRVAVHSEASGLAVSIGRPASANVDVRIAGSEEREIAHHQRATEREESPSCRG